LKPRCKSFCRFNKQSICCNYKAWGTGSKAKNVIYLFFELNVYSMVSGKNIAWGCMRPNDDAVALQPRPGLGLPFGFHDSLY
jgi:hypothetical protein